MQFSMDFRRGRQAVLLLCSIALLSPCPASAEEKTGAQIYRQQCVSCHGDMGQGTDENQRPLLGDRSVPQLVKLIARTMPKDAPKKCTGEDAEKVAAYIYHTFYSKAAQERNKPPRIELSRLTVRQYKNAVADLVGSFRPPPKGDERRGLSAEYFKLRRFQNNNRVIERLDPEVRFEFGDESPDPAKIEAHEFSIRWNGSVVAPETGAYEFIVRTEHAARLWINEPNRPLIDAWVKSGNDTEYRATRYLLGGRAYPLRLEFSKAKQGVDDSKTNKNKPPAVKASIALLWKLAGRAPEIIPARCLTPTRFPESYVVETPFPPDDRSIGYERGTAISKAWDEAIAESALEIAGYVTGHLRELSGVREDAADRVERLRQFSARFAEGAFRRPITGEEKRFFVDRQFEANRDPEIAVKRVVLLVLLSPRFLYREMGNDPHHVASRIAFTLWDSLPDQQLADAAIAGRLATREQIKAQVERMVADPRARSKVREFLLQWLKVDQPPDVAKDPRRFPGFDVAVASDLRTSLELFLDDVIWSPTSDFRQLLLADTLYLNGRLARFYGADLPAEAPFTKVAPQPGMRAGVLSHPYLMATFAYTGATSPIHRGVFLARSVLGLSLRPPPEAAAPLPPELHPELTTRERVVLQTKPESCLSCHSVINPLGFPLERFDAVGRLRDRENGRPIDSTGMYLSRSGATVKFSGVRDLAKYLAESEETQAAFVEQLFHYMVKQPVRAFGPNQLEALREGFTKNNCNVRRLLVEIVTDTARPASAERP